jgi:hypothetical protein
VTVRIVLVALCALVLAPAATAGTIVDRAAAALRQSPVYVDPSAEKTISAAEAARVREEIETKGHGPIYVAVLPEAAVDEAGGSATGVVGELHRKVGADGVYAVVAGGHFRAGSTDLKSGRASKLAAEAFDAHRADGIGATLVDFVDRVGKERNGEGDGGSGLGKIGWFPLILIAGIVFFVYRAFRRRRAQSDAFREVREAAREDLVALADDVQQLEQRVEGNDAAKRDYLAALEQYGRASESFDRARTPQALAPAPRRSTRGATSCPRPRRASRGRSRPSGGRRASSTRDTGRRCAT